MEAKKGRISNNSKKIRLHTIEPNEVLLPTEESLENGNELSDPIVMDHGSSDIIKQPDTHSPIKLHLDYAGTIKDVYENQSLLSNKLTDIEKADLDPVKLLTMGAENERKIRGVLKKKTNSIKPGAVKEITACLDALNFGTRSGMGLHIKRAHPVFFNDNINTDRKKERWTREELQLLALNEASLIAQGGNVRIRDLVDMQPGRSIWSIRKARTKEQYQDLLQRVMEGRNDEAADPNPAVAINNGTTDKQEFLKAARNLCQEITDPNSVLASLLEIAEEEEDISESLNAWLDSVVNVKSNISNESGERSLPANSTGVKKLPPINSLVDRLRGSDNRTDLHTDGKNSYKCPRDPSEIIQRTDKSGENKDSKEEDMELCAAPVRPQPAEVKPMESFTEQYFKTDVESRGAESIVKSTESCLSDVQCVRTVEEKTEITEEMCSIKTSLVTEKIQSFSESFQASLKLNERVDSSNDTCNLDIEKIVQSEAVAIENDLAEEAAKDQKDEEIQSDPNEETTLDIKEKNKDEIKVQNENNSFIENEQEKATSEEVVCNEAEENKKEVDEPYTETENASPKTERDDIKNSQSETKKTDNSLYPTVVVRKEDGRDVEAIECKEIKKEVRIVEPLDVRRRSSGFVAERDITSILEDANAVLSQVAEPRFQAEPSELRVAVVGAGPAGLCAARHLVSRGFRVEVYEQCPDIGGTWVYCEEPASTGSHPYPLHSSLYHDLWTNLPKEAMRFPDFDYPDDGTSYLPSEKILQYLVDYADHFNLHPAIKIKHQVKRVAPVGKGWSVTVEDLTTNKEDVSYFDAVMVCSGPNNVPVYPLIEGIAKFSGKQIHSRDYRRAETYTGKRVLIVGLGPSGLDITYQLAKTAKQVILSHNKTKTPDMEFPQDVILKPKVASLFDKTVTFADGTTEEVDVVIYCTGYTYNFPFLTEDCGIIVDQYVGPLYKHLINIERPTMCIVGLPKYCPHQYMVDYQVRAYLNILLGESKIPSKEEMVADLESDIALRSSEGQRKKDYHKLSKVRTQQYMDDLAKLGNLDQVEPVMFKLFHDAFFRAIKDFKGFRNYVYKIIDNENYEIHKIDEKDK
ncbi:unnamed protein product [Nezara viridula]|uniref:Flavin-containing monooxygenase n=1 Tax=Nezara viridula TaxID=85310 RepID=A0A9P0H417_NEZVI|nr:unnamed protein product [Nezara viridula]